MAERTTPIPRQVLLALLLVGGVGLVLALRSRRQATAPPPAPPISRPEAREPTPEAVPSDRELALEAAREFLLAWEREDYAEVWELMSEPARDLWREILVAEETGPIRNEFGFVLDLSAAAKAYGASEFDDPRELFFSCAEDVAPAREALAIAAEEQPDLSFEGDLATVTFTGAEIRVHLGRDGPRYRVHHLGFPSGDLELLQTPSGRRIPVIVTFDLVSKRQPDRERWLPRAPRLGGASPRDGRLDRLDEGTFYLFADAFEGLRHRGSEIAAENLTEFLHGWAERRRDFDFPGEPSVVELLLYLDRDQRMARFREILLAITDPEVRIRPLFLPARVGDEVGVGGYDETGLRLWLAPSYLTTLQIRVEEVEADLVLRGAPEAAVGSTLGEAVGVLPEGKRSVRLRCGPRVTVEKLMLVLQAFAQMDDVRLVLDIREVEAPESTWGLELDGKPVRLVDPTGPVKSELGLQVWR